MMNSDIANNRSLPEVSVVERFLESRNEESFVDLFRLFTPQLVAFFRSRGCDFDLSEDLTQEVMLTVYRKAWQIRDRTLFRGWLLKIARNALYRHYGKQSRAVEAVDLAKVADRLVAATKKPGGSPAFEFRQWMDLLGPHEREALTLYFVEEWEYHEIASAKAIPIGTAQWRVFNAKRKLAPHLRPASLLANKAT